MLMLWFIALFLAALPLDITGVVVDQTGGLVAGAKVTLEGPDGKSQTGITDSTGTFLFTGLGSGDYLARVEQPGFNIASKRFKVRTSAPQLRIVLEIAELHEKVIVSNPDARVNTETADNLDVIKLDRKTLNKLPVLGNDIVGTATQFLDQGAIGAGGISVVVDGLESKKIGVSASAVQEVRINQNPYSAEFDRPGRGRIEIITENAEPQFHGSGEFLFRDHHFEARNPFATLRPPEQRKILEGHFTGPLTHSKKTRFLLSGNHEAEDLQNIVFARTPAGIVRQNSPYPKRQTEFSADVRRQLNERHSLLVRYNLSRDQGKGEGAGGFILPESSYDYTEREHEVFSDFSSVITPRMLNEFRVRLGRQSYVSTSRLPGVRQIVVQDAFTGGGSQSDRHETENRMLFNDVLSWTHGIHMVKAGVSVPGFRRRGLTDYANSEGTFSFSSLSDFRANRPYLFEMQRGLRYLSFWQEDLGLFVQDEFRPHSNLSVTLGVRYDWQNYLASHTNFAPRLSLAFSPSKERKTVLRTGAGMFHERTGNQAIADLLRFDGDRLQRLVLTDPGYPDPLSLGGSLAAQPSLITRFAPDLRSPYLLQYSAGVERQLQKSLALAVNYIGVTGTKLFRSRDANAPLPPLYLARPLPNISVLRVIESAGRMQSHSLDINLRGSISEHFNGILQYAFGRTYNNTSGIGWFPANSYDLSGEWGRADFDVRHRFRTIGTFKAGELFDLGAILSMHSGQPYTITTGRDDNRDGRATDRPPGVPRNSREGYGRANLDLRLSREFKLKGEKDKEEGPSIETSLEAFNVLNRVNYTTVVGNLSSPFFGQPVAAAPARRMQLRVEFKF